MVFRLIRLSLRAIAVLGTTAVALEYYGVVPGCIVLVLMILCTDP